MSANPFVTMLDCGAYIVMTRPRSGYRKRHVTEAFILPKWRTKRFLQAPPESGRNVGLRCPPDAPLLAEVRLTRGGFATDITEGPNGELIETHIPVVDVEGRALRLPDDLDWGDWGFSWRLLFAVQVPDLPDDEGLGPRLVEMAELLVANEMDQLAKEFADALEEERVKRESDEAIGRMKTLAAAEAGGDSLAAYSRVSLHSVGGGGGGSGQTTVVGRGGWGGGGSSNGGR